MAKLGATARGVAVVDTSVTDAELKRLNDLGIRGIRFNLVQSGATTIDMLEPLSRSGSMVFGWHRPDPYVGDAIVENAEDLLQRLPSPIVFDHLARIPQPAGVDPPGLRIDAETPRSRPDLGETVRRLPGHEDGPAGLRRCQ